MALCKLGLEACLENMAAILVYDYCIYDNHKSAYSLSRWIPRTIIPLQMLRDGFMRGGKKRKERRSYLKNVNCVIGVRATRKMPTPPEELVATDANLDGKSFFANLVLAVAPPISTQSYLGQVEIKDFTKISRLFHAHMTAFLMLIVALTSHGLRLVICSNCQIHDARHQSI